MPEAALKLVGVTKSFGHRGVLDGVDFEVAQGARVGIIGPAASGKSVLLKLCCGLERPDRGEVIVPVLRLAEPDWDVAARESQPVAFEALSQGLPVSEISGWTQLCAVW